MMKALSCTLFAALVTLVTSPTAFADIVDVEFLYTAVDSTTGAGSLTVTAKGIDFTGTMPTPTLNQKDSTAIVVPATAVGFLNDDSDTGSPGTSTGFHLGWSGPVTLTGTVEDQFDPNTLTSMVGVFNSYDFVVDLSYEIGDAYSYEIDIFDDNGEIVPNDAVGNYRIAGWMGDDGAFNSGGRRESTGTVTYGVGADTENKDKSGDLNNSDSDGDDVGITIALREAQGDVLFIDQLIFGGELQQDDFGVINSDTSALVRRFVTLDPDIIGIGGTATLGWVINPDADTAIIEPGGIDALAASDLSGVGEVNVMPILTTTYTLTVTPTVGTAVAAEALVTVLPGSPNNVYAEPAGGWDCRYDGNVTPDLVGWIENGSEWDGSGIGAGDPGGLSIHDDGAGNIFCRIQDTGDPRDYGFGDPSNRKMFFVKHLDLDPDPCFDDDDPLTDEGVTLYFRSRVAVDSVATGSFPLDDAHPDGGAGITAWPAGGDGYGGHGSGKGNFGIFADEGASGSIISFSLSLAATDPADGQGLNMNAIDPANPANPSEDVDSGEGTNPVNLVSITDPTAWQDVWISIYREDFGGLYMNRCEIYRNGALTPVVRFVTCGKDPGYDQGNNVYLTMGMGDTEGIGAMDVDFYYAKYGNHIPAGAGAFNSSLLITEFRRDPGTGNLRISWESKAGMKYNLRSVVDPSDPLNSEPGTWPPVVGHQEIDATPPINTVLFPYPAEDGRYFVVEEFRPPPVPVLAEENFDGGAVLPAGWSTGPNVGDTGTTLWEVGFPTHFLGPFEARSLPNCAGTNLASAYGPDTNIYLRTPPIDLTAAGAATLNYDQFTYTDQVSFQDFGTLKVLDATTNSVLAVIEARVEGASADWSPVSKQLPTEALGKTIKIEFGFIADDVNSDAGWFVDNVGVTVP